MARKIVLDDGILELDINGRGLLRFNASDFNVYQRFATLAKELPEIEQEYRAKVEQFAVPEGEETETTDTDQETEIDLDATSAVMDACREIDRKIKQKLAWVFGPGNDFDALLGGVNLMAFGRNGERVITNLIEALSPYLESGAKQHQKEAAQEAVEQAKRNRAQRRAMK